MKTLLLLLLASITVININAQDIAYGDWEISEVVDEFGDPTGDKVKVGYFEGKFNNSAQSGASLIVKVVDYGGAAKINLYEYSTLPNVTIGYKTIFGLIKVKRQNGDIETYDCMASESGGLYFGNEDYIKFSNLINNNNKEKVKVIIEGESFGQSKSLKYFFTLVCK